MRLRLRFLVYLLVVIGFSEATADSYVDYFRAVNTDNASGVESLLERGFDPNTLSEYGQTGLYLAIRDDSPEVTAVLLASPALKVDLANVAGETPLMMAALRGKLELTKKLIAKGAKIQREGWTPLHYAATGPNVEVVALLLDLGARIDARAPNGNTPLMMAANFGDEESVRLLLKRGADKRLLNDRKQGAADLARASGREWLAALLE